MTFLALFPLNNSIVPLCNLLPSSLLHLRNTFYSSHPIHQLLSNLLQYQSSTYKIFLSLQINHQQPVQFFPLGFNIFSPKDAVTRCCGIGMGCRRYERCYNLRWIASVTILILGGNHCVSVHRRLRWQERWWWRVMTSGTVVAW